MAENLLKPDSAGSMPGGITAADEITRTPTPGAGHIGGDPVTGGDTPGNPTATGPAVTGQVPTGGKAVPDDAAMENGDTVGDNDSMDDSGDGSVFPGNQGAQPATPGATSAGVGTGPTIREAGNGGSDDGGVPTGGLSGTTGSGPSSH